MADVFEHTHQDDVTELLSALLDDDLAGAEQARAQQLVSSCPGCRAEFADLQAMRLLLQDLPLMQPPRSFTLDPAKYERRRWSLGALRVWGSAFAAILVFALVGLSVWQPGSSGMPSMASAPQATQPEASMLRSMAEPSAMPEVAMLPPAAANAPYPTSDAFGAAGSSASDLALPTADPLTPLAAQPFASELAGGDPALKQTAPTEPANDAIPELATQTALLGPTTGATVAPTDVLRQTSPISGNQTADLQQDPAGNAPVINAPPEVVATSRPLGYLVAGTLIVAGLVLVLWLRQRRR